MQKKTWPISINTLILGILLTVGIFLRFYNLKNSVQFLGDQGRDAIIVAKIFTEHDFPFIGPVTSVGNMYLGPLYYYFMVPWLWLTYPSPMGPVHAIATLSVLTIFLIYRLGRDLVGEKAALWAAFLFTFSRLAIIFGRFSWNPNPAPIVSLIMVWATYKAWQKNIWYWPLVAVCFSVLIQLHYLTLLAAGGAGLIWLLQAYSFFYQSSHPSQKISLQLTKVGQFMLPVLVSVLIFAVSLTPLILFDLKHDFLNTKAFGAMFTTNENFSSVQPQSWTARVARVVKETHGRSMHILLEPLIGKQRSLNTLLVFLIMIKLANNGLSIPC